MSLLDKAMNIRAAYTTQKRGYKLEDRKEFIIVRNLLSKLGLPTTNFDRNLSTLLINENHDDSLLDDKLLVVAGTYNARTNILNLPEEECDIIHELFHLASNDSENKDSLEGCKIKTNSETFASSLNEGIADFFTSLAKEDYVNKYPYESLIAKYIARVYGYDIFRQFFNGDAIGFFDSFKNDKTFIMSVVRSLDRFHDITQKMFISDKKTNAKKDADEASKSFVEAMSGFIKLLQLKNIDESEFLSDLKNLLYYDNSEYVIFVNSFFENGSIGLENIYNEIISEEGMGLK